MANENYEAEKQSLTRVQLFDVSLMCIACVWGALLFLAARSAYANEIEGFRLGMSMDQVKRLANQKGYSFSNGMNESGRWVSYILMRDGPSVSFCGATLSAVNTQRASNLHETTSVLKDWRNALGEPEVSANPTYSQGTQFSTIDFKWLGQDNVRRSVTISQYGQSQINIGFGYSYIRHPCLAP